MIWLRQTSGVLRLGLRSSLARPRHLLLIVSGLLIASLTLLSVLTIPAGLERIAAQSGLDDVVVVLASSRGDETDGVITPELVARIGTLPGVARRAEGSPIIAPQFVIHAKLPRRRDGQATAIVRGVTPGIWDVVGERLRMSAGSHFEPGVNSLVSGEIAARQYVYASSGSQISLHRSDWHVSGEFSAEGSLWESELWGDLGALQAAYNAQGRSTTVWVRLLSPSAFEAFAQGMRADPALRGFPHMMQQDFYAQHVAFLATFVRVAAGIIAIVLGLMAILASNNAVGLALRARRRELAVLRATGFGNAALFSALLIETLLVAAVCAGIAAATGLALLDARGIDSSTANTAMHFTAAVTPGVMLSTLAYALLLGLLSAWFPAWQSLHAPLVTALARE